MASNGTDDFPETAKLQVQIYALQTVISAVLVRHLERSGGAVVEAKAVLEIALLSIHNFQFGGANTRSQMNTAWEIMDDFATDTISSASQAVRRRNLDSR